MTLRAEAVSVELGNTRIVHEADLRVEPGEFLALLGPNGAGKSTLLRAMGGELSVASGRVLLDEIELDLLAASTQAQRRAVLSQAHSVVFDFSVDEILRMGWTLGDRFSMEERDLALEGIADECELAGLRERRFNSLSGGEQRRVQFARSLLQIWRPDAQETRYLLLDEPTASLDLAHELLVLRHARQWAKANVGVMAVLHDLNLAARFADRIALLKAGRIVANGTPSEVMRNELLTDVYRTEIVVEDHAAMNRLVVHT